MRVKLILLCSKHRIQHRPMLLLPKLLLPCNLHRLNSCPPMHRAYTGRCCCCHVTIHRPNSCPPMHRAAALLLLSTTLIVRRAARRPILLLPCCCCCRLRPSYSFCCSGYYKLFVGVQRLRRWTFYSRL